MDPSALELDVWMSERRLCRDGGVNGLLIDVARCWCDPDASRGGPASEDDDDGLVKVREGSLPAERSREYHERRSGDVEGLLCCLLVL